MDLYRVLKKIRKQHLPLIPTEPMKRAGAAQMWEERGTVGYDEAERIYVAMAQAWAREVTSDYGRVRLCGMRDDLEKGVEEIMRCAPGCTPEQAAQITRETVRAATPPTGRPEPPKG